MKRTSTFSAKTPARAAQGDVKALLGQGLAAFRGGRRSEAEKAMRQVLRQDPTSPDALHVLGLLAAGAGQFEAAERLLRRCVRAAPDYVDAHNNLGNVLAGRGALEAAAEAYSRAAELAPGYPLPHYNLGRCLRDLGRLDQAETAYRRALELVPDNTDAMIGLGNLLRERDQFIEAEALYRQALARRPDLPEVLLNLGNIHRARHALDEARLSYQRLLAIQPDHGKALLSLAMVAMEENRLEEAAGLIARAPASGSASAQTPDRHPATHEILAAHAALLAAAGDRKGALQTAQEAMRTGGDTPELRALIAAQHFRLKQYQEAVEVMDGALKRFGERAATLLGPLFSSRQALCDWGDWEARLSAILQRIRAGEETGMTPRAALLTPGLSPADLLAIARRDGERLQSWADRSAASGGTGIHDGTAITAEPLEGAGGGADGDPDQGIGKASHARPPERLRIGYLSSDLRDHAVAHLCATLFESHDRSGFEIFAYSLLPAEDSGMRRRLAQAFEHFTALHDLSHLEAARRIRDDRIQVLVDLNGYTYGARTEILALRPAPVQVNWLGFPGTLGVPFMDYLIADRQVIPPEERDHYSETLAYMPDAFMPFDTGVETGPPSDRAREGLPEAGMVFCCFNSPDKITPDLFGLWCDVLAAVPNAVLWLSSAEEATRANLLREAAARNVSAERVIFASPLSHAEHLARIALADLFLDTRPYNAHTTAMDALWSGVPVLTCPGGTFASRVAASLLQTAGLPELIAPDLDAYRERALSLARDPDRLAALRRRLRAARGESALFDMQGFARALEDLYTQMWERRRTGQSPAPLSARRCAGPGGPGLE